MPYSGDPGGSPSDAVWFLVGDTDAANQELRDAEVAWLLVQYKTPVAAAIEAARALEAKFSGLADMRMVGDLRVTYTKKAERYKELKLELIALAGGTGIGANPTQIIPVPYQGGQMISDKEIDRLDPDMVQPFFRRGMDDEFMVNDPTDGGGDDTSNIEG